MKIQLSEAARIMGARLINQTDASVTPIGSVSIDSRTTEPGDLFVAFEGDYTDGHSFLGEASLRGAVGVLVTREVPAQSLPQLVVPDVAAALVRLAAWARDAIDPIVVGITGSTGKTGTKDMLAAITSKKMKTAYAPHSYNNEIGVPLTLLRAEIDTEVLICEMGARGPGQIRELCDYVRPTVGVVTNVGVTHFGEFGSREAIAATKAELVSSLPEGGTAVLNADDVRVIQMATQTSATVVTFGRSDASWLRGDSVRMDSQARATFRMELQGESVSVALPVAGEHQVANALAASAAALTLGLTLLDCRAGLEDVRPSPSRMEIFKIGDATIVNDAYNSNPDSLAAALKTCAILVGEGRFIAVLGQMAELGAIERSEHLQAGRLAGSLVTKLIVVGEKARAIAEGAREAGFDEITEIDTAEEIPAAVGTLGPGDLLLIKGSRVTGLDKVASMFTEAPGVAVP